MPSSKQRSLTGLARAITVALAALVLGAGSPAAAPPVIELSRDAVDFGAMGQQEIIRQEITVRNTGGEDLVISEVYVSCPCTVVEIADEVLPPGGTTVLGISIHSRDYQGPIDKHVEISSNDPERPTVEIPVCAFIHAPVMVDPPERKLEFGEVARGESTRRTASFHAEEVERLELIPLEYNAELLKLEFLPQPDPTRVVIAISLQPDAPAGSFRELLLLKTNAPGMTGVDLELSGTVLADLVAEPELVNFRFVKAGQRLEQDIRVRAVTDGVSFRVTGAEIDLPGLAAEVVDSGEEGEALVRLAGQPLPVDDPLVKERRGRMKGTLRILTDLPAQPEISVDLIYLIRM